MLLIGCYIGHHVSKLNHLSKTNRNYFFIFYLFFSREWKFVHPINRSVRDELLFEDEEEKAAKEAEMALIEKKRMRYLLISNCASFILGMGM
jgi:hypothetical protein